MAGIAFFDLDKTLLSVNSASLWVRRELAQGHITRTQAARAGVWLAAYSLGVADMQDVIRGAVRQLEGRPERAVINRTLAFWRNDLVHTIRPRARAALQAHRAQGDLLFLLTSSTNYLSAPVGDELQLDGFCANRFEVHDGVFTGACIEPLCYGPGKVEHARAVADKLHIDLRECAFYTDSVSDVPMLEAVGRPVVVDPDFRLRRIAARRGWPTQDWGTAPAPTASPPTT